MRLRHAGMNQAWYRYGADFGNADYVTSRPHLLHTLDVIRAAGGNSVRKISFTSQFNIDVNDKS